MVQHRMLVLVDGFLFRTNWSHASNISYVLMLTTPTMDNYYVQPFEHHPTMFDHVGPTMLNHLNRP